MLIRKTEAAARLGVKKQQLTNLSNKKMPPKFFKENEKGVEMVDTDHPEWKALLKEKKTNASVRKIKNDKVSKPRKKSVPVIKKKDEDPPPPPEDKELQELALRAGKAELRKSISTSTIQEEKAKQEIISTEIKKKGLGPMDLLIHFFSFGEGMISQLYRRFHEISPELSALYLQGKDKEAVKLMVQNQEVLILDAHKELVKALKEEGFHLREKMKKELDD